MRLSSLFTMAALTGAIALAGCNAQNVKAEGSAKAEAVAAEASSTEIFEVHRDGRIHVFYDMATYRSFLNVGETAYRLTRIGGGPNGETLEFGLTKADKKKGVNTPAVELFDGKREVKGDFYGEMRRHGRIYVFDQKADMDAVRQIGDPSYMYTQIGAGPKGETVVYVLNKNNKKKQPVALMAKFKAMQAK